MKRILMMLALAAFLVAALSVSALSAFADAGGTKGQCKDQNGAKCTQGAHEVKINPAKCETDVKGLCKREGRDVTS